MIFNPMLIKSGGLYVWQKYETSTQKVLEQGMYIEYTYAPVGEIPECPYTAYQTATIENGKIVLSSPVSSCDMKTVCNEGLYFKIDDNNVYQGAFVSYSETDYSAIGYYIYPVTVETKPVCGDLCIGLVTSDLENAYPKNGANGDYWYKKTIADVSFSNNVVKTGTVNGSGDFSLIIPGIKSDSNFVITLETIATESYGKIVTVHRIDDYAWYTLLKSSKTECADDNDFIVTINETDETLTLDGVSSAYAFYNKAVYRYVIW